MASSLLTAGEGEEEEEHGGREEGMLTMRCGSVLARKAALVDGTTHGQAPTKSRAGVGVVVKQAGAWRRDGVLAIEALSV